jgi:hypothetical protein
VLLLHCHSSQPILNGPKVQDVSEEPCLHAACFDALSWGSGFQRQGSERPLLRNTYRSDIPIIAGKAKKMEAIQWEKRTQTNFCSTTTGTMWIGAVS